MLALTRANEPWLLAHRQPPPRLALYQPKHERLTESAAVLQYIADLINLVTGREPPFGLPPKPEAAA